MAAVVVVVVAVVVAVVVVVVVVLLLLLLPLLLLVKLYLSVFVFIVISAVVSDILTAAFAFKGHEQLREVKCGTEYVADTTVTAITLQKLGRAASPLVTLKSLGDNECTTFTSFAACTVTDTVKEVRVIVTDLAEGETRQYTCTIQGFRGVTVFREEVHINVTRPGWCIFLVSSSLCYF